LDADARTGPQYQPIVLRVVDDGLPPLSNTVSFTIFVNDYIEATAGST